MSIVGRLSEKSWLTPGIEGYADPAGYRPAAITVGLYVYFCVAVVIFTLLVGAYLMRMGLPIPGHGGGDWRPMPKPPLLWVNTGVLMLGSVAWEGARRSGEGSKRLFTVLGGLLGLAFLAGQLLLWRQYQQAGYYLAANPANAFFYVLTAVHGLHIAGGLYAWARVLHHMTALGVRLCAIYWHFLLLVWIFLAALLVMT
jgi:cytochrome c oxidase subunit 3